MQAERRKQLEALVDSVLGSAIDGVIQRIDETVNLDFKEEAGRRGRLGQLFNGDPRNSEAAGKLADEVACFANTPGGGVLIVGVEDGTGRIIGTELEVDWLRSKINDAVEVAPDIQARMVNGLRVLVLFIAEAEEPVLNLQGNIRWRVGEHCTQVDRAQWWQQRRNRAGIDISATASALTIAAVSKGARQIIAKAMPFGETHSLTNLLMTIGATVTSSEHDQIMLTEAAVRAFTDQDHAFFEFTEITVPGGAAKRTVVTNKNTSAIEQLEEIIALLRLVMQSPVSPQEVQVKEDLAIPLVVFREALLNALVHMDWNRSERISVQWFSLDQQLVVRSPGGFPAGVSAQNVLSHRRARYPAFADLFRALGYIEKSGLGVDRMYVHMVSLGFRPPSIIELPGQYVECSLTGGRPVAPMVDLLAHMRPIERKEDLRVILILDYLLRNPWLDLATVKQLLQYTDDHSADLAIAAASGTALNDAPLITRYDGGWMLGEKTLELMASLLAKTTQPNDTTTGLLPYRGSDFTTARQVVRFILQVWPDVTTSQLCDLTGMSRPTAVKHLKELTERGELVKQGQSRATHYTAPSPQ